MILGIENCHANLLSFVFSLLFFIQLRGLLEDFSGKTGIDPLMHLHFILYYFAVILAIVTCLKIFTRHSALAIFRVIVFFFPLILLGPTIDICLFGFTETRITYLGPQSPEQLAIRFLTFFGAYSGTGATTGLRIHLFMIISSIFFYSYLKSGRSLSRAAFSSFFSYCILFLSSISPAILDFLTGLSYSDQYLSMYFFILVVSFLTILLFISNRHFFEIIFKDARFLRITYYLILVLLGMALGYKQFSTMPEALIFKLFFLLVVIVLAIFFSIVSNNEADVEIDKISNKDRPLLQKNFSVNDYRFFGYICLALSLIGGYILSYQIFLLTFLFIGNYFIYSMPPIRFKRVPVLSKLTIALNSWFMALASFSLFLSPGKSGLYFLSLFPGEYILFFILLILPANFIDLKDFDGDKAAGINTLPVISGLAKAKRLIGFFFALPCAYLAYLDNERLLFCTLFSLMLYRYTNEEKYNEKKLFAVFLSALLFLIADIHFR